MSDLTFLDRVTIKKNALLHNQLQVQLQIMGEEYRMINNDLDKHSRDVSDFLVYIRHTVPGLSYYNQPDSRSMRAQNIAFNRRYHYETVNVIDDTFTERQLKEKKTKKENNEVEKEKELKEKIADNEQSYRLQHKTVKNESNTAEFENKVYRTTDLSSLYTTRAEAEFEDIKISLPANRRTRSPKYGKDAYTQPDQILTRRILNRFDTIFYQQDRKHPFHIYSNTVAEISENLQNKDLMETKALFRPLDGQKLEETVPSNTQIMKNRLTWSAPNRHNKHRVRPATSTGIQSQQFQARPATTSTSIQNQQFQVKSATSTSIQNQQFQARPATTSTSIQNQQFQVKPATSTSIQNQQFQVKPATSTSIQNQQFQARPATSTNIQNQQFPREHFQHKCMTSYPVEMSAVLQRPLSAASMASSIDGYNERFKYRTCQQIQRSLKRPRTSLPSYELKHKSMSVPKQQLAGFLAEVHSRSVDTRAILKKAGNYNRQ